MTRLSLLEWLHWRRQGITSTDASIIMRAVPPSWGTVHGLWMEKTGRPVPPRERTQRMKRGSDLEPRARALYEKMTGLKMPAVYIEHAQNPIIRSSFDGINDDARRVLEIKCPGAVDHATAVNGRIPDKYIWQCVHHLMTVEYEDLDYFSFDGEKGVIVPFKRDLKLEQQLFEAEKEFWGYVQRDECPPKEPEAPKLDGLTFQEKWQNVLKFRSRK